MHQYAPSVEWFMHNQDQVLSTKSSRPLKVKVKPIWQPVVQIQSGLGHNCSKEDSSRVISIFKCSRSVHGTRSLFLGLRGALKMGNIHEKTRKRRPGSRAGLACSQILSLAASNRQIGAVRVYEWEVRLRLTPELWELSRDLFLLSDAALHLRELGGNIQISLLR